MIAPDQTNSQKPSAQTIGRWLRVCLIFVVPAILCIGEPLTIIMFAAPFGLISFVAQAITWKVVSVSCKQERRRQTLCFLVPLVAAGWLLFDLSFFYGRPRAAIGLALQERPPLLFWATGFVEDGWTDYTVRLHVIMDRSQLQRALANHFEKSPFKHGDKNVYFWKNVSEGEATCHIETDDQFSYAEIQYGVD